MARKRPAKKSSAARSAKAPAKARAAKKPAKKAAKKTPKPKAKTSANASAGTAKAAKAAKKSFAAKTKTSAAKKARASKAVRKAAATKGAKRATSATVSKRAASKAAPVARRSTPRISAGRRATPRKVSSREALAKKTLVKPVAVRKPAKKRPVKRTAAGKAAGKTAGKTARSRLVVRAAQKLAAPVLRDGARRRVVKPTAPRRETRAAPVRRGPFRLHSLGVRDEHPTDRPAIETLLREAYRRNEEAARLERLRADGVIALALVAEYESEIVGHVALGKADARLDGRALKALVLTELAVAPSRQGKGIGSVLVAAVLEAARTAGFEAVFVSGRAAYHGRFGFNAKATAAFESAAEAELLALELKPGALSGGAGTLGITPALQR